ncbi:MAG: cyclase family protein [Phycisphaerales bacterium]
MLYDLSPLLSSRIAVFPGDTPFERRELMHVDRGDHISLSAVTATVHLGSHADAPVHYGRGGRTLEQQPLELYIGPCVVARVPDARGRRVGVADLAGRVPFGTQRLLIATGSYPDPEQWNPDFAAIDPELVRWLDTRGVRLVGIDTPSVDTADSKDLPAHAAFFAADIAIIEGLVLTGVPEGEAELIALPLRIEGADASPVRAILRTR